MKKFSLILAEPEDVHVKAVMEHIKEYPNCEALWIDTEHSLSNLNVDFKFDKGWSGTLNGFDISNINSIWYRRPKSPKAGEEFVHKYFASLAEDEMRAVLHNFYRISNCPVLPHPGFNREADHKLLQLKVANSIGFKTPFTVMTNNKNWAKDIPESIEYYCVKAISAYHWVTDDGSEFSLKSAKVHKSELQEHSKDFGLCPTLLQEYIEKKYEWRVTVIGKEIFACRLDSQKVKGAEADWRIVDVHKIPHKLMDLPNEMNNMILEYLNQFNLDFGAFDFIQTENDEFIFLECNPNGQWLWIELFTGARISKSIANYLFK